MLQPVWLLAALCAALPCMQALFSVKWNQPKGVFLILRRIKYRRLRKMSAKFPRSKRFHVALKDKLLQGTHFTLNQVHSDISHIIACEDVTKEEK